MENGIRLSVALYGLNNTANSEGLIPTLLVFGSIPKISLGNIDHLSPNQRERFAAMETARKQMEVIVAEQRLKLAEKTRTKSMEIFKIPIGSEVHVFREKKKKWEGPFELISYDGYKTAQIKVENEIKPFSITAVKKFLKEELEEETENLPMAITTEEMKRKPTIGSCIEVYWPLDKKFYPG